MNTTLLAISFDSAFEQGQSNVMNQEPVTSTGSNIQVETQSTPASTLVFAGISYWTLLTGLIIAAAILLGIKFWLKHYFYKKDK